jgi:hypothetical protein
MQVFGSKDRMWPAEVFDFFCISTTKTLDSRRFKAIFAKTH